MSSTFAPGDIDIAAFFETWTDRAGRLVEHGELTETTLPLQADATGFLRVRLASPPGFELRMRAADATVLAAAMAFRDDAAFASNARQPLSPEDSAAIVSLLRETLPEVQGVLEASEPLEILRSWRAAFTVAGLPETELFVVETSGGTEVGAAATPEVAAEPAPTAPPATSHGAAPTPAAAGSARPGSRARATVLLVDTDPVRADLLSQRLRGAGLRVLDHHAPRAVLDWALSERVVDVVVLDSAWAHAARLRQNLGADPGLCDLPLLPIPTADGEAFLTDVQAALR